MNANNEVPRISNCSQCGKQMVMMRKTKMFCRPKCRQLAYRVRNNLPLTWVRLPQIPQPISQTIMITPNKVPNYDLFTIQSVVKDGLQYHLVIDKKTNQIKEVFKGEWGKEKLL